MFLLHKSNSRASSRKQINLKGVDSGVLILPNNDYRVVFRVTPINFELRSEAEKDLITETYQSILNSLPCPIQILVRVREVDMTKYLDSFKNKIKPEKETVYKNQLKNYQSFVKGLVKSNKILSRHFYIVLPYKSEESVDFELVKKQLSLRSNILGRNLNRLGMRISQLSSLEILDLFYGYYSPELSKQQAITNQTIRLLKEAYF